MDTSKLTLTPQIVQEQESDEAVGDIVHEILLEKGMLADYLSYAFGSHWYVELPRHLNDLHEEVGEQAVRDVFSKLLDRDKSYGNLWDAILKEHDRLV